MVFSLLLPSLACVMLSVIRGFVTGSPLNLLPRTLVTLDVVDDKPPDFAI
jgi:hypothetical protein